MDNCYPRSNRLSHTVLSKPQKNCDKSSNKTQALQAQKRSTQSPSSSLLANSSQPSEKKARKMKKKKYHQKHKKNLGSLATNINTNNITSRRAIKNMSLVTYFNCNKTGHYARNCPKPKCKSSKTSKN